MTDSSDDNHIEKKLSAQNYSGPRIPVVSIGELAVLLNAVIIIVAIYFWLQPLVTQQETVDQRSYFKQVDKRVNLDFDLVESALLNTTQNLLDNDKLDTRQDYQALEYSEQTKNKFDQIYWIKKHENRYRVFPLMKKKDNARDMGYNFELENPEKSFIANVIKDMRGIEKTEFYGNFAPDSMSISTRRINEKTTMLIQPFILGKKIYQGDEFKGYLIGLTRSHKVFAIRDLTEFLSLSYLSISEAESGLTILAYSRQPDQIMKILGNIQKKQEKISKWGDKSFVYDVHAVTHVGNVVLEYGLYGFLFFGGLYATFLFSAVRTNRIKRVRALHEKDDLVRRTISLGYEAAENEELKTRVDTAEQKNIALLNSISDIIIETDMDGIVVFVNDAWTRITKMGNTACLDKKFFELILDETVEQHKKEFLMLIRGHKDKHSFSTRLICGEGAMKDVDVVLTPVQINELNNDMRIVATITDMEERNRAQKALIEVEARYKMIWERAAFGLFQLSPEGQYVTANPSMYKILGYSNLDEMLAGVNNANQQVYANYRERMKFLRALEQNEEIRNWETQIRRKDGTLIWINENSRLVRDEQGRPLHIEGSIEDVTERVETATSLKEAKVDSDMANRAKSEFLANMSHELRTPLNAIIGFSEIIRDEVMGPVGQKAYWEYARDINKSGQRLLRIINEILDISRIETGDRELNESIIDLKKLSEKCIDILGGKIRNAELSLVIEIPANTPNLLGEELAVKQMLMNILSNAIKFTPAQGKITISTEVEDKGSLRFSITDTGIGIKEDDLEKVMSPFTQLDGDDLARQNSGTGLGLTLVNALVKMHSGRFELLSQKGIGTTATLIFPIDRVLPKNVDESDLEMKVEASPLEESVRREEQANDAVEAHADTEEPA